MGCGGVVSGSRRLLAGRALFELPTNSDITFMSASERVRYSVRKSKTQESSFDRAAFRPPLPATVAQAKPATDAALVQLVPRAEPRVLHSLSAFASPTFPLTGVASVSRDELVRLLPEGLAGESARDLLLQADPRSATLEHVLRRQTGEILWEIEAFSARQNGRAFCENILLDGKRGVGKSSILNFVVAHVRENLKNRVLVVFEPHPSRYLKEVSEISRASTGIFIQNDLARGFLERLLASSGDLLRDIPVQGKFYGQTAIDGASSTEYWRRGFMGVAQHLPQASDGAHGADAPCGRLRSLAATLEELALPSMSSRLPCPRTVEEMAQFGLEQPEFAQQAVYEVVRQIREQKKYPVLVVVDEFNETLPVSEFLSLRYENTRFNGKIPGYHLGMGRLFCRPWRLKRGVNLFATSWRARNRRDFRPELLGFDTRDVKNVAEFDGREFKEFVGGLVGRGVLNSGAGVLNGRGGLVGEGDLEYWRMASGGNGWQARRLLTTLF